MNIDYYEVLGIEENAEKEEIKKAYRALVKKYHPDVNDASNASVFFRMVEDAYQTLYDAEKRREYDDRKRHGFQGERGHANTYASEEYEEYEGTASNGSGAWGSNSSDGNESWHQKSSGSGAGRKPGFEMTGIGGAAAAILLKIVLFPVFVIVAFIEKILLLLGGLAVIAGWLLFGLGIIMTVILFFDGASVSALVGGLFVAFIGFAAAMMSGVIIAGVNTFKEFLYDKIFW